MTLFKDLDGDHLANALMFVQQETYTKELLEKDAGVMDTLHSKFKALSPNQRAALSYGAGGLAGAGLGAGVTGLMTGKDDKARGDKMQTNAILGGLAGLGATGLYRNRKNFMGATDEEKLVSKYKQIQNRQGDGTILGSRSPIQGIMDAATADLPGETLDVLGPAFSGATLGVGSALAVDRRVGLPRALDKGKAKATSTRDWVSGRAASTLDGLSEIGRLNYLQNTDLTKLGPEALDEVAAFISNHPGIRSKIIERMAADGRTLPNTASLTKEMLFASNPPVLSPRLAKKKQIPVIQYVQEAAKTVKNQRAAKLAKRTGLWGLLGASLFGGANAVAGYNTPAQ